MALERRNVPARSASAPRPPRPQAPAHVKPVSFESDRFERGLERRWEQAWNRARAAGR